MSLPTPQEDSTLGWAPIPAWVLLDSSISADAKVLYGVAMLAGGRIHWSDPLVGRFSDLPAIVAELEVAGAAWRSDSGDLVVMVQRGPVS